MKSSALNGLAKKINGREFWLTEAVPMAISLDTLELTLQERAACEELIRARAYQLWREAGQPDRSGEDYWLRAERQWIEQEYVPRRPFDGRRPAGDETAANQPPQVTGPTIFIDGRPIDPKIAAKHP